MRALSGVSCPGLIEASALQPRSSLACPPYPGFLAPASLKLEPIRRAGHVLFLLIRGFLPRPH